MMRYLHPSKKICLFNVMLLSLLPGISNVKAQTQGLIFKPKTTVTTLDPNNDQYTSSTTAGFTTNNMMHFINQYDQAA